MTRLRSRSKLARPYIWPLIILIRLTLPSTAPELWGRSSYSSLRHSRAGFGRSAEGRRWRLVGPGDGVVRVASIPDPGVTQQFPDDARVAHRPPSSRCQRARADPVLIVAPAHTIGVDRGPRREVTGQDLREA